MTDDADDWIDGLDERRPVRRPADVRVARGVLKAVRALRKRHPEAVVCMGAYDGASAYIVVRAQDGAGKCLGEEWVAAP
jgi:hypothetical protein